MLLTNLTTRFLRFNLWANERITSWLTTVDENLLYQKTGSSFGTIHGTLQHMLSAQVYWYAIILENRVDTFGLGEKIDTARNVMVDLVLSSQQLMDGVSLLSDQQLTEKVQAADSFQSRYEYILHVVNHSSYHRGQIVTMSRALGITKEIPVTDYDAYLWWTENNSVAQ